MDDVDFYLFKNSLIFTFEGLSMSFIMKESRPCLGESANSRPIAWACPIAASHLSSDSLNESSWFKGVFYACEITLRSLFYFAYNNNRSDISPAKFEFEDKDLLMVSKAAYLSV